MSKVVIKNFLILQITSIKESCKK